MAKKRNKIQNNKKRTTFKLTSVLNKGIFKDPHFNSGSLCFHWENYSFDELLNATFSDLNLHINESPISVYIARLRRELKHVGLIYLNPTFYFGTVWENTEDSNRISIPFYLAHPKLAAMDLFFLPKRNCEGYSSADQLLSYLRHEVGHFFDTAYKLDRTKEYKKIFGNPGIEYNGELFQLDKSDQSTLHTFVSPYAQKHPWDDFAETFAIWLDPNSDWKKKYAKQPMVLKKLRYISRVVKKYGNRPIKIEIKPTVAGDVRFFKMTLGTYYERTYPHYI